MKICFVGHTFHGKTRSSQFFQSILAELGEVTVLNSSPDRIGLADDPVVEHYLSEPYDLWVFWQTEYLAARLIPFGLRNAVIAPMYDGAVGRPDAFFQQFVGCRFASFSRELHRRLQSIDCRSASFEYWPEPAPKRERSFAPKDWSAFFWERRPLEIPNMGTVAQQCRLMKLGRLHVHAAPDFATDSLGFSFAGNMQGVDITTSSWFDDPAEYRKVSGDPLFVFAPRLTEGIGMVQLEAMSRGQIVIAADRPTANQYIGNLSSGILYDPDRPYELPRLTEARVAEMSAAAYSRVVFGRQEWEEDIERLKSFLLDDGRRWPNSDNSAHFGRKILHSVRQRRLDASRTERTMAS